MRNPASIWYAGRWRTPEGVRAHRQATRERTRLRDATPGRYVWKVRRRIQEKEAQLGSQETDS